MRRVSRITTIALACAIGAPLTIMAVSPVASANVAAKHAARVTTTLHGTRGFAHRIGSGAFRPARLLVAKRRVQGVADRGGQQYLRGRAAERGDAKHD